MHSIQLILIEADSVDEAFDNVANALAETPEWSDWHEANSSNVGSHNFAGRWSGEIFKNSPSDEPAPNFLRYADDPALAERVISEHLEYRLNDIREFRNKGADLASYSYDPYEKGSPLRMEIYYARKLAQLLNDEWTPDSGIYDLHIWTGSLSYFIERVKTKPEQQWLIPVDFHH
jgi:hypothetical protein